MVSTQITATYRLQLRGPKADPEGRKFDFYDAIDILDYLKDLGVSHLFLSPILTAVPESNHGYDVIDPTEINPELGGKEGFVALSHAARDRGLGIIIDIVPNHVGVAHAECNPWWWDVLKNGKDSHFEGYFDIDWHEDNGAGGKLGLPILGQPGDEDKLTFDTYEGEPVLRYFEQLFPIAPGTYDPESEATPAEVLDCQAYKLMYWRDGVISYRRFFSVNSLAGLKQEDPLVFEHSHRVIRELVADDLIDGVRVDHPDGLTNPFGYLARLREVVGPNRWLVIEKILAVDEALDPRLRVDGTTGYDALRELDGLFVARDAEDTLSMLALKFTGSTWDEEALSATEYMLKREVAHSELAAEVRRLARAIRRDNFSTAGSTVTDAQLVLTIEQLVASMPVYRADYVSLTRVTATVAADLSRRFPSRRAALDLIVAALISGGEAFTRFAQVCGAVMAKGVEDTTFYRASRLVALNEVGGAPGRFGVSAAEFHLLQQERARLWSQTMTTLSTHDTKRGEDVRARIIELADCPRAFSEIIDEVTSITPPPDGATGHFLLQNILGTWPVDGVITDEYERRMLDYTTKAIREAGIHTTWTEPNQEFEERVSAWVQAILHGPVHERITQFIAPLAHAATLIGLGRKMLHLIAPGIPDIYQGEEYFCDRLVDPDNRRFVDYEARKETLERTLRVLRGDAESFTVGDSVTSGSQLAGDPHPYAHLLDRYDEAKQAVVAAALHVRSNYSSDFVGSDYQAVFAEGEAEDYLIGLGRGPRPDRVDVIAVATRKPFHLWAAGGWGDTTLTVPEGSWTEVLTGRSVTGTVDVESLLSVFPTALLVRNSSDD